MKKQQETDLTPNGEGYIKEISQQVLEEKESIIKQLTNQLKISINTTNIMTQQIQDLRAKISQIDITALHDQGFIKEDSNRYFLVLDVTQSIKCKQDKIKIDANAEVVNAEERDSSATEKINYLQESYLKYGQQCDMLLKTLEQQETIYNQKLLQKEQKQKEMYEIISSKEQKEKELLSTIQNLQNQLIQNSEEKKLKEKQYLQLVQQKEEEGKESLRTLMEKEARQVSLEGKIQKITLKLQETQAQLNLKIEKQEEKSTKLIKILEQKQENVNCLLNNIKSFEQTIDKLNQDKTEKQARFLSQLEKRQARENELLQLIEKKQESEAVLLRKNEELQLEKQIRKKVEQKSAKEEDGRHSERKTKKQQILQQTVDVKQALCHTLKQKLDKKERNHEQIVSEKDLQIETLTKELAKYRDPNELHPQLDYHQLQEELESLELELDEQKRLRALEKAEWKQQRQKLQQQVGQLKLDDEYQKQSIQNLQTHYQELLKENKQLKELAIRLQRQSDNFKITNFNEIRTTNENLIKQRQQEQDFQSPHIFLPRSINSAEYFHIENEIKQPEIKAVSEKPEEETENIFDKVKEEENGFGQMNKGKIEDIQQNSPERQEKNLSDHLQIQSIDKSKKESLQVNKTNQSFPQARTDVKDPDIKPFQDKEVKEEEKDDEKDKKKDGKRRHPEKGQRCMRPTKPDKPGKHRKIIYLNY